MEKDKLYYTMNIEGFICAILIDIGALIKAIISLIEEYSTGILLVCLVFVFPLIIFFIICHIEGLIREIREMKKEGDKEQ